MNGKSLRPLGLVLRTAWSADRRGVLGMFLLGIAELGVVAAVWVVKLLVDALTAGASGDAVWYAVLLAALLAASRWASVANVQVSTLVSERTDLLIDKRIITLAAALPGIAHHELPEYRSKLEMLRFERSQLTMALGTVVRAFGLLARAAATVVLLAVLNPLLLLLPLFAVPSYLASRRAADLDRSAKDSTLENWYQAIGLYSLTTSAEAAKEMRVFGLQDEVPRRYGHLWNVINQVRLRARLRGAALVAGGWLIFGLGFAGAVALIVYRAATGVATPGDVVAVLTVAVQLNGQVEGLVGTIGRLLVCLRAAERFQWLVDYATAQPRPAVVAETPQRLHQGISLREVSFRYPGTDRDILTDINLDLPAGSTVALVGENGAGKTTLVKLLCGFYPPTSGRITVDDTDLTELDPQAWRERTSAAFQDFVRFELAMGETVGIGDLPYVDDRERIEAALERASASEVPPAVDHGLDTLLGRSFGEGTDLSGGQWQKLALARGLMRPAPLLLVLDEPTSSLDAETEFALLERYVVAAREAARRTGGVTLLVSHRFSTVRMADRVAVLDGGRLTELGSHDELINDGALYAELYELQARGYR